MIRFEERTLRERLCWSYANLAMAHAAVEGCDARYGPKHYSIRTRLYRGLMSGSMKFGPIYDDEREKLKAGQRCSYCGKTDKLTIDHLIPRILGGADLPENFVWACRSCNSSKQGKDVLVWFSKRQRFPPLLVLRRYLKLAYLHCEGIGVLDEQVETTLADRPFDLDHIPLRFPPISGMALYSMEAYDNP